MKLKIQEYEIVDHGIEHEQYFQGCGVAFTKFDHVATGIGSSLREALEDAAEQLSEQFELSEALENELDETPDDYPIGAENHAECDDEGCFAEGMHYYASIRVKV